MNYLPPLLCLQFFFLPQPSATTTNPEHTEIPLNPEEAQNTLESQIGDPALHNLACTIFLFLASIPPLPSTTNPEHSDPSQNPRKDCKHTRTSEKKPRFKIPTKHGGLARQPQPLTPASQPLSQSVRKGCKCPQAKTMNPLTSHPTHALTPDLLLFLRPWHPFPRSHSSTLSANIPGNRASWGKWSPSPEFAGS